MTDLEDDEAAENKKKKGGKDETGGDVTRSQVVVSQGFYEKMGLLGASSALIAEILSTWRHLQGQSLFQKIREFAAARASAHAEVDIKKGKDYGLLHNFFQTVKNLPHALTHRHHLDHKNTPGPQ